MDNRGQGTVEYLIVLLAFTALAFASWRIVHPAVGRLYRNVIQHRAEIQGMLP